MGRAWSRQIWEGSGFNFTTELGSGLKDKLKLRLDPSLVLLFACKFNFCKCNSVQNNFRLKIDFPRDVFNMFHTVSKLNETLEKIPHIVQFLKQRDNYYSNLQIANFL